MKIEYYSAIKRNANLVTSLEELGDCVSGKNCVEDEFDKKHVEEAINMFLSKVSLEQRNMFLWRYWYFESIDSICSRTGYSQSKVASMLFRMRKNLRNYLEKEGIEL